MATLTTAQVWKEIEANIFAVLGMVSAKNEARTAGIMYVAQAGKLYITTDKNAWKTRHVAANPHVSLTITIPKSVPLMPWIKVPAATITFAGVATIVTPDALDFDLRRRLFQVIADDAAKLAQSSVIVVEPVGEFVTYGVGISLMEMRDTVKARGRAPVKT
ncbi:MAG TPA: hypothetical protein GYA08_13805 [Chloroflexi bacterium]|nr:hypothetical protein [Chloroflexota bacterium]